ncbi:Ig-like domain-containing protein [Enterobacteriaceae bacterium H16N7]|nr:Ig-like domain-containing protein [Dryocola clanedunensis]
MNNIIDVISRKTAEKIEFTREGNFSVPLSSPSVIEIHQHASDVSHFVRQGNDLLIYMADGSVIRCNGYFISEEGKPGYHSELVFDDGQQLTHITFTENGTLIDGQGIKLAATETPIANTHSFITVTSLDDLSALGWIAGGILGGGAVGAAIAHSNNDGYQTKIVDNTKEVEQIKPTFLVTDDQGSQQGLLPSNALTDDSTPGFSGTGQAGATIQIKDENGNTIASAMVAKDGTWAVNLPTQTEGEHTYHVVQIAGSTITDAGEITLNINTDVAQLSVANVASDNIVNAAEQANGITLSGDASYLSQGTSLMITLNGKSYVTKVDSEGHWSVHVPSQDSQALSDGSWSVTVTGEDATGNTVTASKTIQIDTSAPTLSVNTIAQDNVINAHEAQSNVILSGKTDAEAGQTVALVLNGKQYFATVGQDGAWSMALPAADMKEMADNRYTLDLSVTDKAGNTTHTATSIVVDTSSPTLSVDALTGDNILNTLEHGQAQVLSGVSHGATAGDKITISIAGHDYTTVVEDDGKWSLGLPAKVLSDLPEGANAIRLTITDAAGNSSSLVHHITVDSSAPILQFDPVSHDNILNAVEAGQALPVSGTSSLADGSRVTVELNGLSYGALVQNGVWHVDIPAQEVSKLAETTYTLTATSTDSTGNSSSVTSSLLVDTSSPAVVISTFAGDNQLNGAEVNTDQVLSGRVTGVTAGEKLTVKLGDVTYSAQVQNDMSWRVTVPASDLQKLENGSVELSASITDGAGNTGNTWKIITVDHAAPTLTIDTVALDDMVNKSEHQQAQIISGDSTGASVGELVTVTLTDVSGNDRTFTTSVDANGKWNVALPASTVASLNDGEYTITASVSDKAGNSASAAHALVVDTSAPTIAIATLAIDDVVNATEKGQDLQIRGTSDQPAGTEITVQLNGKNYHAVTDESGNWSATVPASAVTALGEAIYTVSAQVTDAQGNTNSASHDLLIDSAQPALVINSVTSDDILNASEIATSQTVSGSVTHAQFGDIVSVNIGGKLYQTTVQADLSWSLNVTSEEWNAIGNGDLTLTASVTNAHGNTGTVSRDITIDAQLPGLRVDSMAGDDIVNAIEHQQNLIISGSSTGLNPGSAVTVTVNGKEYAATVLDDGNWQTVVPANDVSQWGEGSLAISASGLSSAGNAVTIEHQVQIDLSDVVISIDMVAQDNALNAAEKGTDIMLSGSTENVEAGQTVTITFAGHRYATTIQTDGSWSFTVPAADVAELEEGTSNLQVSVSNLNGNSSSAAQEIVVDTQAPTLLIDPLSSDNIISATEAQQPLAISGSSSAEPGSTVTVTLNGENYTASVQADGRWSISVAASDVANLPDSVVTINASVNDNAGNQSDVSHSVRVDTSVPVLKIDTVAGDDVINQTEHQYAQVITGSCTGAEEGDAVTLTINGHQYTSLLDEAGNWSVGVPGTVIKGLADGEYTVTAILTDRAGNTGEATHTLLVDTSAPVLRIDTIAGDDILNAAEKAADVTISGAADGLSEGSVVTVTLNGKDYQARVDGSGHWSTVVPAQDIANLGEAFYQVTVSATDSMGNTGTQNATLGVDSNLPGVLINVVAGDDIINVAEASAGQIITGRVTGVDAGAQVTIDIGGQRYTALVQADLTWSLPVSQSTLEGLGNGALTLLATVTDGTGNTGSGSREIAIDAQLPGLRINTIAGDDVVNAIEHSLNLVINGTSTDLPAGSAVTVSVNGKNYAATVLDDGSWQTVVPGADVAAWNAGDLTVSASGQSAAGNPISIEHAVDVDLSSVAISINTVSTDDILNAVEKGTDLYLSGNTQNVEANQSVTLTFAGHTYTATVQADGSWSYTVPAADMQALKDGDTSLEVSVSNISGNSASSGHLIAVDTHAPTLLIDTLSGDDVINAAEKGQALLVTGTSDAESGQTVNVQLNGENYTATVQVDGSWSLSVPPAAIAALSNGSWAVSAHVEDVAGNSSAASRTVLVSSSAPQLTFDTVAGDDVINAAEHTQSQIISGSCLNTKAGDRVTVSIDGHDYVTAVDAEGKWSVGVPADVVSQLADGNVTIGATVTDSSGNSTTTTHNVVVETTAPSLSFETLAGDNILNAIERGEALTVSGGSTDLATGSVVTVTLNGKNYTATTDTAGHWQFAIQPVDLATLGQANYTLTATANDEVGNSVQSMTNLLVDTSLPGITVNPVTADDILNSAEVAAGQNISGLVNNAAMGDVVNVVLAGETYTTTVQADLSWSISLPAEVLTALGNGELTLHASVTNQQGNTGSNAHDITIDASLPGIRIDTVAGDDVINSIEHQQNLIVTGNTSGIEPGNSITLTINGQTYLATVTASGTWSAGIPAADVSRWADGDLTIHASGTSDAGNTVAIDDLVSVDLRAVAISVETISTDDVINAMDKGSELVLSGDTQNVEMNQTVTIVFAGRSYVTTVQADGSWRFVVPTNDVAALSEGQTSVQVSVSNVNGNAATAGHEVRIDASTPAIIIDSISTDNIINGSEAMAGVMVTGHSTAEAGQVVTLSIDGQQYTGTVLTNGSWNIALDSIALTALADNDYSLSATVSDLAGNESTAIKAVTIDTQGPAVSIDTIASDDVVNNMEQQAGQAIRGSTTAEAGQVITLMFNHHTYTATVEAGGSWSVNILASDFQGLADGDYTIDVSVSDKAGNTGSGSRTITLDGEVPVIAIDPFATDDVVNAIEHSAPLVISGSTTAAAGQTVVISLNGQNYSTVVKGDGSWSYTLASRDVVALQDANSYVIHASVNNGIGNSGSADHTIVVDTTAPQMSITIDAVENDTGISASDFITTDNQVVLVGFLGATLGSGDKAQISLDGGTSWIDLQVNGTSWRYSDGRILPEGVTTYDVRIVDAAGNIGATDSHEVVIDTVAPDAAMTIVVDTISRDTGLNNHDFITSDNSVTLQGSLTQTLAADEHAQISLDGGVSWADVAINGISWSYVDGRALSDGDYIYQLRVIDAAGNVGATASQLVTVDTVVPESQKTITIDSISDDTGNNNDFITGDNTLTVRGSLGVSLPEGEYAQISLDGGLSWQNVTTTGTNWFFTDPRTLSDGVHQYFVRIVDDAGNVGNSASENVTVDTTLPGEGITFDTVSTDSGISSSDFITNDNTLTVNGSLSETLAANEHAEISYDGGVNWVTLAVTGTHWTYIDGRTLADGNYNYLVRIVDAAGNEGASVSQTVTVDTTVPGTTGTIDSATDNTKHSGELANNDYTDDSTPLVHGSLNHTLAEGEIAQLWRDGVLLGQVTMSDATHWSYQDGGLQDGAYQYQLKVVDIAGNYSESDAFVIHIDTHLPTALAVINDLTTQDKTPIITGTLSESLNMNEAVIVTVNGVTYSSAKDSELVVDPRNNTWYLQVPDDNTLGTQSYNVTANVINTISESISTADQGTLTITTPSSLTPNFILTGKGQAYGASQALNHEGNWEMAANQQLVTETGRSHYTVTNLSMGGSYTVSSFVDINRDGYQDLFTTNDQTGTSYILMNNGNDTFTAQTLPNSTFIGTDSWYGGIANIDFTGDGYLDMFLGDAQINSNTIITNTNGTLHGISSTIANTNFQAGTLVRNYTSGMEVSAVDLNNDGFVDIAQHTTNSTTGAQDHSSLSTMFNNGDGTFTWQQNMTGVMSGDWWYKDASSMSWADFNNDGSMDLYLGMTTGNFNKGILLMNDGDGNLLAPRNIGTPGVHGSMSTAVDWNMDGAADIIRVGDNAQSFIYTNNGLGQFAQTTFSTVTPGEASGTALIDNDWDGDQDLFMFFRNGNMRYVENTNTIAEGSAIHLKIVDTQGINSLYGNTVNLYNSAGERVASTIINPQGSIGQNDASSLVSFYGLDASEIYHAEMVHAVNGAAVTDVWDGLQGGDGKENYTLTVEASNGAHSAVLVGTGYNDTFVADSGKYIYNGAGGWEAQSDHQTWTDTGGVDIVDFKNATAGVSADLSKIGTQSTGFNTATFNNIEGLAGSNLDDNFTGSKGNNSFEGRGGNDTFNIGNGGHDTLLYKLLDGSAATGGNGSDSVNGFTVGTWEGTADTDRIDVSELLKGSSYSGTASAHYVNGVATLDASAGNINDYLKVEHSGSNTLIQIDRDGTGSEFDPTTVITLNGVQTDLATLLANHQLHVV